MIFIITRSKLFSIFWQLYLINRLYSKSAWFLWSHFFWNTGNFGNGGFELMLKFMKAAFLYLEGLFAEGLKLLLFPNITEKNKFKSFLICIIHNSGYGTLNSNICFLFNCIIRKNATRLSLQNTVFYFSVMQWSIVINTSTITFGF